MAGRPRRRARGGGVGEGGDGFARATAWDRYDRATGGFTSHRLPPMRAMRAVGPVAPRPPRPRQRDLREEVLAVVRSAGGGRTRIADLQQRFGADTGPALRDLQREGKVALFPLDNRREITPADERAAVYVAGSPHHVVYAV